MPKYISGRYKKTPQSALPADRYRYLSPGDAEPNLGDTPTAQGTPNLPAGQQYIVVSFIDRPGERFWIPNQGGIIPGSLSVFEESELVGGLSSTTQLNFIGQSITAEGVGGSNPGVAVTITVAPPGNENEVLFVGAGGTDFDTDTRFTFNNGLFAAGDRITVGTGGTVITTTGIGSVGIGTTNPTQKLHLDGNFRITGTIYDSLNQPGSQGDLIMKTATGGLEWVEQQSITAGAGGTIGQIQFHAATGLVDGANNFYYDYSNNRVGIGSTQPTQLLDVLGVSTFSGGVFVDTLNVSGITTFKNKVHFLDNDKLHFGGAEGDNGDLQIYHDASNSYIQDLGEGELILDGNGVILQYNSNSKLTTTAIGVTVTGITETQQLSVSGISSLSNVVINSNTISTKTGTGNLVIDSDASVNIKDPLIVSGQTESVDKDSGSLVVEGGIGVEKSVNIGKNLKVTGITTLGSTDANTGFTTTVGDLYVGGDLYINDDISFDNLQANTGTFTESLKVTGITTTHELYVGAAGTIGITTILDEDDMVSDSDTALATQQSIKAYVDNEIADIDLDFAGDSGTGSVGLGTQTFTISGTTNEIVTAGSGTTLTIGLPDNVTVSGNLTVNGNTVLGDDITNGGDTVIFGSRISSNILPNADSNYDLGSTDRKWGTVHATTFNGDFVGTADNADSLTTARTFTLGQGEDDDILQVEKTFDGSADVGFALTLKDVGPGAGTYGGDNKLVSLTLDNKGRVTGVTSTSIDFSAVNVATADSLTDSRNIAATGDIAWDVDFKGHENVSAGATLATIVTGTTVGSSTQVGVVTFDNKGRITAASNVDINFDGVTIDKAQYADNAGIATNLKGGDAYQIPYQSSANTTQFIPNGSITGQILQYNEGSAPSWVSVGQLSAGIAQTANNLSGGVAGSIPYQDGPGSTVFLAEPNASGKILGYDNSTNAPVWVDTSSVGTDTFSALTDTPANYTSAGGKLVAVNSGATGLEFIDAGGVGNDTFTGLTDTPSSLSGQGNKLVAVNSSGNALEFIDAGGVGTDTDTFTGLTDTPSSLSGQGNKLVSVNSTGDALEFIDASGVGNDSFLGLSDVNPSSFIDQENKIVAVNSDANALVFIDATNVGTDTDTFAGLTDTPENYTNQGGKLVAVNSGATGLEFIDASGVGNDTFTGLTDTPGNYTSAQGKLVAVNSSGDALEFIDAGGVGTDTDTFVGLTDTPANYTGAGGKLVAVNSSGDALEFIDASNLNVTGTTYTLPASGNTNSVTLTLTGSDSSTDPVTITAGDGISFSAITQDGFTITSTAVGGSEEPVGTIVAWGGSTSNIPSEYKLCNGASLSRTEYADLFAKLGTIHGSDSNSTFNIPDLRNKFIVGAKNTTSTTYPGLTVGATGGRADAILPQHKHDINDPGHNHDLTAARVTGDTESGNGDEEAQNQSFETGDATTGITVQNVKSDTTNASIVSNATTIGTANLPPYYALCFIIKITASEVSGSGSGSSGAGFVDKIEEGDSRAEIIDTATESKFIVQIDDIDKFTVDSASTRIHRQDSSTEGGSLVLNRARDDAAAYELDVYGSSNSDAGSFRIVDYTRSEERLRVGPSGQIGLGGANYGVPGQVLTSNGSGSAPVWKNSGGSSKVAILSDIKTAGTNGGDFNTGGWRNRELNTELDPESFVTLNSSNNYFELGEGSYRISWSAPAHAVDMHQTRLTYANNTGFNNSSKVYGTSEACFDPVLEGNNNIQTRSFGETIITITETTYFKIQHRCQDSKNDSGFGLSKNFNNEGTNEAIYTQVIIQDLNSGGGSSSSGSGGGEPIGTIIAWGGSAATIPSGYQLCDGGVAATDALQEITGTNVPDLTSRFIVGVDNVNAIGTYPGVGVGSTGGNADAVVVSHTHDVNNQGGTGPQWIAFSRNDLDPTPGTEGNDNTGYLSGTGSVGNDRIFNIENQGEDAGNKNLPPYYALCYIIKHSATSGSGSSSGNNQTWLADYQNVQSETGSSVEWTGIPEDTQRIIIMFHDVSPGSNQDWLVQLGNTSGNYSAGVYDASSTNQTGDSKQHSTDGFIINVSADSATPSGRMVIERSRQDNTRGWVATGQITHGTGGGMRQFAGSFASSTTVSVFDRIRFITENGGQCFDGGRISILCEGPGGGSGNTVSSDAIVLQTAKSAATNSNAPIEFTGIPADAYEITLMFHGVTLSGGDDYLIQLGTSSDYIGTGYTSTSINESGTPTVNSNDGFIVYSTSSNGVHHGKFDINKFSDTVYTFEGQTRRSLNTASQSYGTLNGVNGTITRLRIKPSGTNTFDAGSINISYKTPGSGGSGGGSAGDKISEGDTKAEVIETGSESKFTVEIDAAEKFSVDHGGPKIHRQDNSNEGGSVVFNRANDDNAAFEIDVYGSSNTDSGRLRIIDQSGATGAERLEIGPNGEIGLGGANYGTSGQVLTSGGAGASITWSDAPSGGFVTGMIMMFSGTVAPTGWVLCDNSAAAQAANAPDLRDRFIVGTGNSYNLNATGGSANAVLIAHSHQYNRANSRTVSDGGVVGAEVLNNNFQTTGSAGVDNAGNASTTQTGTNANLPPYYALAFIMKT